MGSKHVEVDVWCRSGIACGAVAESLLWCVVGLDSGADVWVNVTAANMVVWYVEVAESLDWSFHA